METQSDSVNFICPPAAWTERLFLIPAPVWSSQTDPNHHKIGRYKGYANEDQENLPFLLPLRIPSYSNCGFFLGEILNLQVSIVNLNFSVCSNRRQQGWSIAIFVSK